MSKVLCGCGTPKNISHLCAYTEPPSNLPSAQPAFIGYRCDGTQHIFIGGQSGPCVCVCGATRYDVPPAAPHLPAASSEGPTPPAPPLADLVRRLREIARELDACYPEGRLDAIQEILTVSAILLARAAPPSLSESPPAIRVTLSVPYYLCDYCQLQFGGTYLERYKPSRSRTAV